MRLGSRKNHFFAKYFVTIKKKYFFLKTILRNYNKNQFEIMIFNNHKENKISEKITNLIDKTVNIGKLNNLEAFNTIRKYKSLISPL